MSDETHEKPKNTIGDTIRTYRMEKGLSQNDVARLARTTPTSISRIETGAQRPGRKLAPALARVLGIDLRYLLAEAQ